MNGIICSNCQSPNRPEAKFCARCGSRLEIPQADLSDDTRPRPARARTEGPAEAPDVATIPVRRNLDYRIGRRTDAGPERDLNEDSLLAIEFVWSNQAISHPAGLFVVADGMGGREGGEIASGILVRAIARRAASLWLPNVASSREEPADSGAWLAAAIQAGNDEILNWARQQGTEMGTTVVAALLTGDQGFVAHVGDSRAYRINASRIERLTLDHSLVESLVVANQISAEEAREHPQANVIYRTIGNRRQVAIDIKPLQLGPEDTLLLCSDGLCGILSDEVIRKLVMEAASPQSACNVLVREAIRAGGDDNITAVIVQLESLKGADFAR